MGYEKSVFGKLYNFFCYLIKFWGICNHFICYSGYARNKRWYAFFRIDQGVELFYSPGSIMYENSYFGNFLCFRTSPCCFNIYYAVH